MALYRAPGRGVAQRRYLHHHPELPSLWIKSAGVPHRRAAAPALDDHQPGPGAAPRQLEAASTLTRGAPRAAADPRLTPLYPGYRLQRIARFIMSSTKFATKMRILTGRVRDRL